MGGDYGGGSSWLEVPGQYMPNTSSWSDTRPSPEIHVKVLRFESRIEVLRRNDQLVRRIGMMASDGKIYRFLLQFAVPYLTRTDERTSQTSYFFDKIFRKDFRASRASLSIQSHPVVPIAQRLRLIGEPDSRTSLDEVCRQIDRSDQNLSQWFNDEVKRRFVEKISSSMSDEERSNVEKSVRREAYAMTLLKCRDDNMLSTHIFSVLQGPEPLYHFRRVFAQQWAVNCLLQYVLSTTERTPGRVVFLENDGRVLSPEFRTSYGNQGYMDKMLLPFRLTPNLDNLIGPLVMEARFIPTMAIAASAVHDNRDDMEPIWRLLMRDDLVAFYTKAMAKSDQKTVDMEKQLIERITRNVAVLNARFAECVPSSKPDVYSEQNDAPIDKRIRELVETARSPDNLCMMPGNYQAWL